MSENLKSILIVGQGAVASALAKKLKQSDEVENVFIAPGNGIESEDYKNVDLREEDLTGLLKFVLEENIDLTIPVSEKALKSDIVSFFASNGQDIFGPTKQACNFAINKSMGKKFIYRLKALTSKFGIFDKAQAAEDYLVTANFPVVIRTCEDSTIMDDRLVCPTMSLAKEFLYNLLSKNETDILIEEFAFGKSYTVYFVTDGYSAVELASVLNYKFMEDGDGGILTNGIGCVVQNPWLSKNVIDKIKGILENALGILERKGTPYLGIIGVEGVLLPEDRFYINEFKPFLQEHDAACILNLVDDNLLKIFKACIEGYFADEYENISTNDYVSVASTVLARSNNKVIKGFDKIDDFSKVDFINVEKTLDGKYLTSKGAVFTINRTAATLSRARELLYEDLAQIKFDGIKYRKDIATNYDY